MTTPLPPSDATPDETYLVVTLDRIESRLGALDARLDRIEAALRALPSLVASETVELEHRARVARMGQDL